jgi:uncharacterized membrane protein YjjB (DUF3815 family)
MRHALARSRLRRGDVWIASTGLLAAMAALPLSQTSMHGPEVAAVLAVAATALLAGQRWAIAVVVIAELLLVPALWPRAFLPGAALDVRIAALAAVFAIVPGVLAMRRAAAALVLVTGRPRTQRTCRRFHMALAAVGVLGIVLPLAS